MSSTYHNNRSTQERKQKRLNGKYYYTVKESVLVKEKKFDVALDFYFHFHTCSKCSMVTVNISSV
jgi:hypothetical protein